MDAGSSDPTGQVYDWYLTATELHDGGDPAGAVELLEQAVAAEPTARSLREALARAQFDARYYPEAITTFEYLVSLDPTDHYAQFGLGLSLHRVGRFQEAASPLALAVAMRPDLKHYNDALVQVRATLRARGQL